MFGKIKFPLQAFYDSRQSLVGDLSVCAAEPHTAKAPIHVMT